MVGGSVFMHSGQVRGVVLAAGQGKRMKSSRPKVLHDVFGKAVISRVVDAVAAVGIEHLHVVVGHAHEQVENFLAENLPPTVRLFLPFARAPTRHRPCALLQIADALQGFVKAL